MRVFISHKSEDAELAKHYAIVYNKVRNLG